MSGNEGPGARRHGGLRRHRRVVSRASLALLALIGALLVARAVSGGAPEVSREPGEGPDPQRELASSQETVRTTGEDDSSQAREAERSTGERPESESAQDMQKLSEYRTDYRYSDSQGRRANLEKASGAVDGTVIQPGEVFSFNDLVEDLDYSAEKVFSEGGESVADGGGLCQVSSTLYVAATEAGLEEVERHPHYTTLPYIRPGLDATVWFGKNGTEELDMKFRNTTGSDVIVREYVDEEGFLVAEIWGQPTGKEVKLRSEQDFRDLDKGIQWSTYKTVKEDGETVSQSLARQDLYSFPPPGASEGGYNQVRAGGW